MNDIEMFSKEYWIAGRRQFPGAVLSVFVGGASEFFLIHYNVQVIGYLIFLIFGIESDFALLKLIEVYIYAIPGYISYLIVSRNIMICKYCNHVAYDKKDKKRWFPWTSHFAIKECQVCGHPFSTIFDGPSAEEPPQ